MNDELPFETWNYKEQTRMKHLVFADYFDKWVKILGKYNPLNYIDGFGGIGAYKQSDKIEWGSPILAIQTIIKNNVVLKRDPEKIKVVIIDEKNGNLENIKRILKYLKLKIKPTFINDDFDKAINKILDSTPNLAPTFFLIDPFGFKIKITTLEKIMQIPKSEILVTFMYNGINRNLSGKDADKVLNDLFGCTDWKKTRDLPKEEKEKELVELYRKQLKKFCKFVGYYRLSFPDMARTYYYLFHLTNHPKGCSIMKSCFAKYNFGRVEYKGEAQYQQTLFEQREIKIDQVKKMLLDIYKNKEKLYLEIIEELIDETPYLESEISSAIKELGEKKEIKIKRSPELTPTGKKRKSILNTDVISF